VRKSIAFPPIIFIRHAIPLLGTYFASNKKAVKGLPSCPPTSYPIFYEGLSFLVIYLSRTLESWSLELVVSILVLDIYYGGGLILLIIASNTYYTFVPSLADIKMISSSSKSNYSFICYMVDGKSAA